MKHFGHYEAFKCEVDDLNGETHIFIARKIGAKESNEISKVVKDFNIEIGDKITKQMQVVFGKENNYDDFDMITLNQVLIAYSEYNSEIIKKK